MAAKVAASSLSASAAPNAAATAARKDPNAYAKLGVREHVIRVIKGFDRQHLPLDLHLRSYLFKEGADIASNLSIRYAKYAYI